MGKTYKEDATTHLKKRRRERPRRNKANGEGVEKIIREEGVFIPPPPATTVTALKPIVTQQAPRPVPITVARPFQSHPKPVPVTSRPADTDPRLLQYLKVFNMYMLRTTMKCSVYRGYLGEASGSAFAILGCVPGPWAYLFFRKLDENRIELQVMELMGLGGFSLPGSFTTLEALPEELKERIMHQVKAVETTGYEISFWNLGMARKLLDGQGIKFLSIFIHYASRKAVGPLGFVLIPSDNGAVTLEGIYNPRNIPGVPEKGATITLKELREGHGPIPALTRAWRNVEVAYSRQYPRP